jgi:hypothetical protein
MTTGRPVGFTDRPSTELDAVEAERPTTPGRVPQDLPPAPLVQRVRHRVAYPSLQVLHDANARRTAEAAAVVTARVVLAMRILAQPYRCAGLKPEHIEAAQIRLRYQDLSYSELARTGVCHG